MITSFYTFYERASKEKIGSKRYNASLAWKIPDAIPGRSTYFVIIVEELSLYFLIFRCFRQLKYSKFCGGVSPLSRPLSVVATFSE